MKSPLIAGRGVAISITWQEWILHFYVSVSMWKLSSLVKKVPASRQNQGSLLLCCVVLDESSALSLNLIFLSCEITRPLSPRVFLGIKWVSLYGVDTGVTQRLPLGSPHFTWVCLPCPVALVPGRTLGLQGSWGRVCWKVGGERGKVRGLPPETLHTAGLCSGQCWL